MEYQPRLSIIQSLLHVLKLRDWNIRGIELLNYPCVIYCIQMVPNFIVQRRRNTSVPLSKWLGVGQFNGQFNGRIVILLCPKSKSDTLNA